MMRNYYGTKNGEIRPDHNELFNGTLNELYDVLRNCWCKETCTPRMRADWNEDNKTLGQCSISAFLIQDIFGGKVYGVPLKDGNYHCFNLIKGNCYDLTSEQFPNKLSYDLDHEQSRKTHFSKSEKYERYLLLKEKLLQEIRE